MRTQNLPRRAAAFALSLATALALSLGSTQAAPAHAEPAAAADTPEWVQTSGTPDLSDLAGRAELHHMHVDAAHIAWDATAGKPEIRVVRGSTPVPSNTVYVRVGPDADARTGREVSRIRLPGNQKLSFLGEPGDVLWNAPAQNYDSLAPVWAGIGAGEMPTEIDRDRLTLKLVRVTGPGWVSVWRGDVYEPVAEDFSTRNPGHSTMSIPAGGHGHYNWTFGAPGRYTFTWQATVRNASGTEITGDTYDVDWLVGTDSDLGRPEGTWRPASEIGVPAEEFEIGDVQPVEGGEETAAAPEAELDPESTYTCLAPGHYDIWAKNDGEWRDQKGAVSVGMHDTAAGSDIDSYTAIVPVPDHLAKPLELNTATAALAPLGPTGTRVWRLPEVQDANSPWVGFSTEHADYSHINQHGVRLYLDTLEGPGRMLVWSNGLTGAQVDIDSADSLTKLSFPQPAHTHRHISFNKPGLYLADFRYFAEYDGDPAWTTQDYNNYSLYFAVGNGRIASACPGWLEKYGVADAGASGDSGAAGAAGASGAADAADGGADAGGADAGGDSGSGDGAAAGDAAGDVDGDAAGDGAGDGIGDGAGDSAGDSGTGESEADSPAGGTLKQPQPSAAAAAASGPAMLAETGTNWQMPMTAGLALLLCGGLLLVVRKARQA